MNFVSQVVRKPIQTVLLRPLEQRVARAANLAPVADTLKNFGTLHALAVSAEKGLTKEPKNALSALIQHLKTQWILRRELNKNFPELVQALKQGDADAAATQLEQALPRLQARVDKLA
jgi:ABC-type amino acid transport substrate-binding protein